MSSTSATFWLPEQISPLTSGQDHLFYFVYGLSIFFFVLIVTTMIVFAYRYRRKKKGQKTANIHGNTLIEIVWSVIPAVLFIVIFFWGFFSWLKTSIPPQDSLEVHVTARKWDWFFTDSTSGAESSDLYVPINRPVKLIMTSTDVIHGFYVPNFRIQKDVLPNQYTVLWFQAEKIGTYPIYCSQYCGTRHSQMIRFVHVLSENDYKNKIQKLSSTSGTPAERGQRIFTGKGACASCHDVSAEKKRLVGPHLYGVYGENQNVLKGGAPMTIKVDDNYIRESVLDPNAKVVATFPPVMPSYKGQLSDKEIDDLIAYIKSVGPGQKK